MAEMPHFWDGFYDCNFRMAEMPQFWDELKTQNPVFTGLNRHNYTNFRMAEMPQF